MSEKLVVPSISPSGFNHISSIGSHLQGEDHEVNLDAMTSNPLGLAEVGTSLTESEKWFVLRRLHFDTLMSLDDLPPSATFIFEKIEQMAPEEAVEILKRLLKNMVQMLTSQTKICSFGKSWSTFMVQKKFILAHQIIALTVDQ